MEVTQFTAGVSASHQQEQLPEKNQTLFPSSFDSFYTVGFLIGCQKLLHIHQFIRLALRRWE